MAADLGAYCSAFGPGVPTNSISNAMGTVYDVPAVLLEVRGAFTNTLPVDAYRGAGKPEANYLMERLVDAAARRCGFDPWRCAAATSSPPSPPQRLRHHHGQRRFRRGPRRG
jgi:carbon-monoxide dehydrogenase large subunit